MPDRRSKLIMGLGVSLVGIVLTVTWVIYRSLRKSSLEKQPKDKENGHKESDIHKEENDLTELEIAPPLAFSSEINLDHYMVDQFEDESSETDMQTQQMATETLITVDAIGDQLPVNLNDTVTISLSDLSGLVDDVSPVLEEANNAQNEVLEIVEVYHDDDDLPVSSDIEVKEMVSLSFAGNTENAIEDVVSEYLDYYQNGEPCEANHGALQAIASNSLDDIVTEEIIMEEPIVCYSSSLQNASVGSQSFGEITEVPESVSFTGNESSELDSGSLGNTISELQSLATDKLVNGEETISAEAFTSKSFQEMNETLEELQKSLGKVESEDVLNQVSSSEVVEPSDPVNVSVEGSDGSNDSSINGAYSITTDSGIGLPTSHHPVPFDEFGTTLKAVTMSDKASWKPRVLDEADMNSTEEIMTSLVAQKSNGINKIADSCNGVESASKAKTECSLSETKLVYRFLIPIKYCGLFIGRSGRNIAYLKQKSNTNISIGKESIMNYFRFCTIEGLQKNIDKALRMIKRDFNDVDVTSAADLSCLPSMNFDVSPDLMQLHLPHGVMIDIGIANIVTAGHVFIQQPTHPLYLACERLKVCMNNDYGDGSLIPALLDNAEGGVLCVAHLDGSWHRSQIISYNKDKSLCDIKLLDIGGYAQVYTKDLRQIRRDFLGLPFQASECYLSNVEPLDGVMFSTEANDALHDLTYYKILQCKMVAVSDNQIPLIEIFVRQDDQMLSVNKELARLNLVKWYDITAS